MTNRTDKLKALLDEQIVLLDGAWGVLLQKRLRSEEDYRGALVVAAESLPLGVSAVAGADYEPEKDPPPATGKRERYTPRTERLVVALLAAADAPVSTEPQNVRLAARPLVNGKLGDVIFTKTFPMMVLIKP